MLRDARINQIGEGANDVLRSFIALVGMHGPGEELRGVWNALHHPWAERRKVWTFGRQRAVARVQPPEVPVRSPQLRAPAHDLGRLIQQFDHAVRRCLIQHREEIVERQYVQERIADTAIDLYASSCVLSRLDAELQERAGRELGNGERPCAFKNGEGSHAAADLFLKSSARRIQQRLAALRHNDDPAVTAAAEWALNH
jgi:alkylation response protein AidB-like acyl-CoA dehydrogenase